MSTCAAVLGLGVGVDRGRGAGSVAWIFILPAARSHDDQLVAH